MSNVISDEQLQVVFISKSFKFCQTSLSSNFHGSFSMARMLFSLYWQTSRICQMHWMENNSRRNSNLTSTFHDCFSLSCMPTAWHSFPEINSPPECWKVEFGGFKMHRRRMHTASRKGSIGCVAAWKIYELCWRRQTARKLPLSWLDSPSLFILARKSVDWLWANGEESIVYKVSPRTILLWSSAYALGASPPF